MVEGGYAITLKTPIGRKRGVVYLVEGDGKVVAKVVVEGMEKKLYGLMDYDLDAFTLYGTLEAPVFTDFRVVGTVSGDVLAAQFITDHSVWDINGQRIRA